VARAAGTLPRARSLVKSFGPRAVLAVGGYAAGPLGLAAWLGRVPLAILEPNSTLGLTNRWLVPVARRAYVAFEETERKLGPKIAQRTGVPLRGAAFHPMPYEPSGAMRVLVLGGSQGAKALNETLPEALALARREVLSLTVLHQAGRDRDAEVLAAYRAHGGDEWAKVVPFLDDVAAELASADLVIERSGGGSIGELCAVGRASILVPFPFAADDHQKKNAEAIALAGAAVSIAQSDATVARLAAEIAALAKDTARRIEMADRARALGRPDAARTIARDLLELGGVHVRSGGSRASGDGGENREGARDARNFDPSLGVPGVLAVDPFRRDVAAREGEEASHV
jgi:UDP-N-acetylglucosamine--N-acetylmuramyl-(pentapeptide) pyrophosphoryl-undecaprenol N-acetylglucosamine transferase